MSKTKTDNNQSVSQTRRSPVATARQERKPKRKARPGFRQRRSRKRQAIPDRPYWNRMPLHGHGGPGDLRSVPADRDEHPVRVFNTFTADLNALAQWLIACHGIHWSLLDSRVGGPGSAGDPAVRGECPAHEECAGAAHGLAGVPMDPISALGGFAARRVSAAGRGVWITRR